MRVEELLIAKSPFNDCTSSIPFTFSMSRAIIIPQHLTSAGEGRISSQINQTHKMSVIAFYS